jgi:Asp-tRNA(Asn)/Glu-tRNA(Gln) amidotransferase A subunit family amidase
VHNGTLAAKSVLTTYGKVAVRAQERTNCVTEILLPEAEEWLGEEIDLNGPLAGIPVSLKDSLQVRGFDTTLGYARWADKPFSADGAMVRLLKDAGACIIYSKSSHSRF